jgi:hypothetical protein
MQACGISEWPSHWPGRRPAATTFAKSQGMFHDLQQCIIYVSRADDHRVDSIVHHH